MICFLSGLLLPGLLSAVFGQKLETLGWSVLFGVGAGALLKFAFPAIPPRTLFLAPTAGLLVLWSPIVLATYGFALAVVPVFPLVGLAYFFGAYFVGKLRRSPTSSSA